MKVFVDSINIRLDGPVEGYLNVYKVNTNLVTSYVTGKKAYRSPEEAKRKARPLPGWIRVGVVAAQHYRNHVNAHIPDYTAALKQHVINDMNAFLARVLSEQPPTVVGGLDSAPNSGDEAEVTEPDPKPARKPRKAPAKPAKAKKPAKGSKVKAKAPKARKPAKNSNKA